VRVAIITESFLPRINGVTNTVCRVVEHLRSRGHQAVVIAPRPAPTMHAGVPVLSVPAIALPGARDVRVAATGSRQVERMLAAFEPDLVHLASPTVLGSRGAVAARRLGVPIVAVFQTDLAGFARRYPAWQGVVAGVSGDEAIWRWLHRVHDAADRTLAPSSATIQELAARGFPRLARWGRGVDLDQFHPRRRDEALHRALAPGGEVLVGYVGRLAPEKELHRLVALRGMPGVRLVLVGSGPSEPRLRRMLPEAAYLGFHTGDTLGAAVASLDVFVNPGDSETFCQAVQEALAAGVPVVASAAGGPLDLVDHGRTGFLVTPGDARALRSSVAALAYAPSTRARMGALARASVLGRTWEALGDELLTHYAEVLGARRTARTADPGQTDRSPGLTI